MHYLDAVQRRGALNIKHDKNNKNKNSNNRRISDININIKSDEQKGNDDKTDDRYHGNQTSLEDGTQNHIDYKAFVDDSLGKTSFFRQYSTLVMRDFVLAKRDPSLYYLQLVLLFIFGFLIGACFLR